MAWIRVPETGYPLLEAISGCYLFSKTPAAGQGAKSREKGCGNGGD
jgi:hypothetical protein